MSLGCRPLRVPRRRVPRSVGEHFGRSQGELSAILTLFMSTRYDDVHVGDVHVGDVHVGDVLHLVARQ